MNPLQLQAEINNWIMLAGMIASVGVHCYQIVVNAGGYRGILKRFRDGNSPGAETKPKDS